MEYSMKLQHLIFAIFSVVAAVIGSHAANYDNLPSVVYWNSMLPKTPMPKVVKELLYNGEWELEDKSTSVSVGKGGVNVNTGGKGKQQPITSPSGGGGGRSSVNNNNKPPTNVVVGKGGVVVRTGPKNKNKGGVYVGVTPGVTPFLYRYAAKEDQLHDNPNVALFFTKGGLIPGSTMTLQFVISPTSTLLLPRKVSESIPFSTKYIPEIYEKFSVTDPDSKEAKIIKNTIEECEEPAGIKGEEKYCATSLESMIDFSISKLGKQVKAISTDAAAAAADKSPQKYTVVGVTNINSNNKGVGVVVCHKLNYPYAVFYCHKTETTEAFQVSLVGADDGNMVKAAAVCHKDTSQWNPKHLAFQVLNVKPGTVPVCHFLPQDHIVWVTTSNN